jgi:hypothetical protein
MTKQGTAQVVFMEYRGRSTGRRLIEKAVTPRQVDAPLTVTSVSNFFYWRILRKYLSDSLVFWSLHPWPFAHFLGLIPNFSLYQPSREIKLKSSRPVNLTLDITKSGNSDRDKLFLFGGSSWPFQSEL